LSSIAFSSTPRLAVCMKKDESRRYPSLHVDVSPLRGKGHRGRVERKGKEGKKWNELKRGKRWKKRDEDRRSKERK
jgi:hypothetical protein